MGGLAKERATGTRAAALPQPSPEQRGLSPQPETPTSPTSVPPTRLVHLCCEHCWDRSQHRAAPHAPSPLASLNEVQLLPEVLGDGWAAGVGAEASQAAQDPCHVPVHHARGLARHRRAAVTGQASTLWAAGPARVPLG